MKKTTMAVYKRTYKGYEGGLTPAWSRFMILPRYSYSRLFQSKFLMMFLMAVRCFIRSAARGSFISRTIVSFLKASESACGKFSGGQREVFRVLLQFSSRRWRIC